MLITEEYRRLNTELHQSRPDYGTSGVKWAQRVSELVQVLGAITILDYGCGKQTLGMALSHLLIRGYDPAVPGMDDPPEPAELVVCGDVLEHIEPDCLDDVLDDLRRCTLKGIFLTISTQPAKKVLADGRNAHLIQRPPDWWVPKIMARWELRAYEAVDGELAAFCLVKNVSGNGATAS